MKQNHYHIWDLPKSMFPRTNGNKAKDYAREISNLLASINYTATKVQQSGLIAMFNIKSIFSSTCSASSQSEIYASVQDFMYHYDNFCTRTYSVREKIVQLLNSILEINIPEKNVDLNKLLMIPDIKKTAFGRYLKKFDTIKHLQEIIAERNKLTHRHRPEDFYLKPQPEPKDPQKKWFSDWSKEIEIRSKRVYATHITLSDINHMISNEIVKRKSINKS